LIAFIHHTEDAVTQVVIAAAATVHNHQVSNHVPTETPINHAVCIHRGSLSKKFPTLYFQFF